MGRGRGCVCVCGWVGVSVTVSVCVQEGASKCKWVCKSVCVSVFGRVRVCMYSMYVLWVFVCVSVRTCVCACVCECSQQLFILGFYHYKQACVVPKVSLRVFRITPEVVNSSHIQNMS